MNAPNTRIQLARWTVAKYLLALAVSNLAAVVEISAVLWLSSDPETKTRIGAVSRSVTLPVTAVAVLAGGLCAFAIVVPSLRWYVSERPPTARDSHRALRISLRQTVAHLVIWLCGGGVLVCVAPTGRLRLAIGCGVVFGAAASTCIGYLVSESILRPIRSAVLTHTPQEHFGHHGILAQFLTTFALCSVLPLIAIVLLVGLRPLDAHRTVNLTWPVTLLVAAAMVVGARGAWLSARLASRPVAEVRSAMNAVAEGDLSARVEVYDRSEIGALQSGFNAMATGVAERDRLRDVFGRHVGPEIVPRALASSELLDGEVTEVSVLFVDLVGSTTYAERNPPDQVARTLSEFFRCVVAVATENHGHVNKFEGDAALVVFGIAGADDAHRGATEHREQALRATRQLRRDVRARMEFRTGIGVAAGQVFAGNIGANERFEFTVIGDTVNLAARLAELAKRHPAGCLAAATLFDSPVGEQQHWAQSGTTEIRGRAATVRLWAPDDTSESSGSYGS